MTRRRRPGKFAALRAAILAAALLLPATAALACPRPLIVHPGSEVLSQGRLDGREADFMLLNLIARRAGCALSISGTPMINLRRLESLRNGQIDVIAAASDLPERREYAWFSQPYRHDQVRLYVRNSDARTQGISNLDQLLNSDVQIIAPRNSWFGSAFEALRPRLRAANRLHEPNEARLALAMLLSPQPRGDVLIAETANLQRLMDKHPADALRALAPVLNDAAVHLMFSKRSVTPETVARFDKAIRELHASGELKRLLESQSLGALALPER